VFGKLFTKIINDRLNKWADNYSFKQTFDTLHGQALKNIFKLKCVLNKVPCITVSHKLDLFDKLITPILGYYSEVRGYLEVTQLETVHLHYMKQLLGVRTHTYCLIDLELTIDPAPPLPQGEFSGL